MRAVHSLILSVLASFLLTSPLFSQTAKKGPRIKTIIIDAGHGGKEVGARGDYSTEAQITLEVAQRLDTLLRQE